MSTCKENCLHYEACKDTYEELTGDNGTGGNAEYCKFFKDRSKFIELPCKVGDVFYGIDKWAVNSYSCWGVGYGYISENKLGFLLFTVGRREYIFGEEAFLTEAEAEQALGKRIPQKPKLHKFDDGTFTTSFPCTCACGAELKSKQKYCSECGQAIDWSETE